MRSSGSPRAVQHDDRNRLALGAEAPADRESVFARHHDVEHEHVEALAREQLLERLGAFERTHGATLVGEVALQKMAQVGVVVGHEHPGQRVGHRRISRCCRRADRKRRGAAVKRDE
jgi:metallophosphoesterase superfamily enzyme